MNNEELEYKLETGTSRQGYFVMAENAFINNVNLSMVEKMVFLSLCTYAGKHISCFPGQTGIAKNLGLSRVCVNTTIKSLELKNGLVIMQQYTETNRKTVNTYFLADVDQKTGEFLPESLDLYRELARTPRLVRGK